MWRDVLRQDTPFSYDKCMTDKRSHTHPNMYGAHFQNAIGEQQNKLRKQQFCMELVFQQQLRIRKCHFTETNLCCLKQQK